MSAPVTRGNNKADSELPKSSDLTLLNPAQKEKRVMEGGETITIYIKSDPVLYCSSGTKKITVWSSLEILFSCKRGGGNVRRVTSEPSPPKIGLGITPSQLELKPCYV